MQDAINLAKSLQEEVQTPKKIDRTSPVETSVSGGNISDRLGKIKNASEGWKNRIGKFS